MKKFLTSKNATKKIIALWLVFVMMLTPVVTSFGGKSGVKAATNYDLTLDNQTITATFNYDTTNSKVSLSITENDITQYVAKNCSGINLQMPATVTINGVDVTSACSINGDKLELNTSGLTYASMTGFDSTYSSYTVETQTITLAKVTAVQVPDIDKSKLAFDCGGDVRDGDYVDVGKFNFWNYTTNMKDSNNPKEYNNVLIGNNTKTNYYIKHAVQMSTDPADPSLWTWYNNPTKATVSSGDIIAGRIYYGHAAYFTGSDSNSATRLAESDQYITVHVSNDTTAPTITNAKLTKSDGTTQIVGSLSSTNVFVDKTTDNKYRIYLTADDGSGDGLKYYQYQKVINGVTTLGTTTVDGHKDYIEVEVPEGKSCEVSVDAVDMMGNESWKDFGAVGTPTVYKFTPIVRTLSATAKMYESQDASGTEVTAAKTTNGQLFVKIEASTGYSIPSGNAKLTATVNGTANATLWSNSSEIAVSSTTGMSTIDEWVKIPDDSYKDSNWEIKDIKFYIKDANNQEKTINLSNIDYDVKVPQVTAKLQHKDSFGNWNDVSATEVVINTDLTTDIESYRIYLTFTDAETKDTGVDLATRALYTSLDSDNHVETKYGSVFAQNPSDWNYTYTFSSTDKSAIEAATGLQLYFQVKDYAGNYSELITLPKLKTSNKGVEFGSDLSFKKTDDASAPAVTWADVQNGINTQYTMSITISSGNTFTASNCNLTYTDSASNAQTLACTLSADTYDDTTKRHNYTLSVVIPPSTAAHDKLTGMELTIKDDNNVTETKTIGDLIYESSKPTVSADVAAPASGTWKESHDVKFTIIPGSQSIETQIASASYSISNSSSDETDTAIAGTPSASLEKTINIPESKSTAGTKISFKAADQAGNEMDQDGTNEYVAYVDNTAPIVDKIEINGAAKKLTPYKDLPVITATVKDNLAIEGIYVEVEYPDGTTVTPSIQYTAAEKNKTDAAENYIFADYSYTLLAGSDPGKAADGTYTVKVTAKDKYGHNSAPSYLTFEVDNTLPLLNATIVSGTKGDGNFYRSAVGLEFTCDDKNVDASKLVVKDNGTELTDITWQASGTSLYADKLFTTEGKHVIEITGADKSDNPAEAKTVEFYIDTTAPVISQPLADGKYSFAAPLTNVPKVTSSVEDNQSISSVEMKIVYPDESIVPVTLTYGVNEKYTDDLSAKITQDINHTLAELTEGKAMDGLYTVYVNAKDKAGNPAEEKVLSFEVDNTNPVVDVAISGGEKGGKAPREDGTDYYYKSDVSVSFTVTEKNFDPTKVTVTDTVGSKATPVTVSWTGTDGKYTGSYTTSTEGTHAISIAAKDKSDNPAIGDTVTFVLDKSKPSISLTLNGINYSESQGQINYTGDAILNVSVSDMTADNGDLNIQIKQKKPDQAQTNPAFVKTTTRDFGFSEEAEYEVNIFAVDKAGNQSNVRTVLFRVDKTAPQLTIGGVTAAGTSANAATVTFTMNEAFWWDATGTVSIYRRAGDGQSESLLKTLDFKPTANATTMSETLTESGVYRFVYNGSDRAGHRVESTQTFTIDRNAPVVTLAGVNNYDITESNVTFTAEIQDEFFANKKVSVQGTKTDINGKVTNIDFGSYNPLGNPTQIAKEFTEDGIYDITIGSTDVASNSSTGKVHFTIDKTAPEIGDISAYDGKTFNKFVWDLDLDELVSDLTVCDTHMYLNGSEYDGVSDIEDGSYTLLIQSVDEVGHESEKSATFVLDTKAPVFIVTGVEDGQVKKESYSINVSLQLDEDTLTEVALNGEAIEITNNTANISVNSEGEYELTMKAVDEAGNEASQTINFTYGDAKKSAWWIWLVIGLGVLAVGAAVIVAVKKNGKE